MRVDNLPLLAWIQAKSERFSTLNRVLGIARPSKNNPCFTAAYIEVLFLARKYQIENHGDERGDGD